MDDAIRNGILDGLTIVAKCGGNRTELSKARRQIETCSKADDHLAANLAATAVFNALSQGRNKLTDDEQTFVDQVMVAAGELEVGRAPWNAKFFKPGRPPLDGETANVNIHLRATPGRKSSYVAAAKHEGKTLSQWMFAHLDKASGYRDQSK